MGFRLLVALASTLAVLAILWFLAADGGILEEREHVAAQPLQQLGSALVSVRLSTGDSVLAAGFFDGVFIFVNESIKGEVLLNIVDLESLEVVESIVIEESPSEPSMYRIFGYDRSRVYYDAMGILYMIELEGSRIVGGQLASRDLVAVEESIAYYFNGSTVGAFSIATGDPLWIHELELYYPPDVIGDTLRGAIPVPVGVWVVDDSIVVLARELASLDSGSTIVSYWLVRADEAGVKAYYIFGYNIQHEGAVQYGLRTDLYDGSVYLLEWARYPRPEGNIEGFAQLRVISLEGESSIVFREVFADYSWPDEIYLDMIMGDDWIGLAYYSGLGKVSFYRLDEGGEPELIANLGLEARILGFTEDRIYYVDPTDYNVYMVDDQGRARLIGVLPHEEMEGLILSVMAPLLPILAFEGQTTSVAYIEGSTIYIHHQGIIIKLEAES